MLRIKIWRFVTNLKRELRDGYFDTRLIAHRQHAVVISNVTIITAPRRQLYVYIDGIYCWIPWLQKVRLRRAITKALLNEVMI